MKEARKGEVDFSVQPKDHTLRLINFDLFYVTLEAKF